MKPEYPDMRPRVEELEAELSRVRVEMEGAHFNEINDLQLKIAEQDSSMISRASSLNLAKS